MELPAGFTERFKYCFALASKFNKETEELADYYVHRRTAAVIVALMGAIDAPWLFTPNRVTFVSLICGVTSAAFVFASSMEEIHFLLYAAFFEFLSITFDCCDGQLARMYGSGSLVGRVLDGICDMIVALSHGFTWSYVLVVKYDIMSFFTALFLLAVAIVTFQQQAMMFDRIKNIFCLKTTPQKGKTVVGMEESDLIRKEMKATWETSSYGSYLLLLWYEKQYLAVQNKVAKKSIDKTLEETEKLSPEEYRLKWRSTMRLVSWCGTGSHAFLFYGCLLGSYLAQDLRFLASWFFFNNVLLTGIWLICWSRVKDM